MNESIAFPKSIKPYARPGGQVVPSNLVIPHSEAYECELIHQTGDGPELEPLAAEIHVAAPVRACLDLVLALALVAVILYMTATLALQGVHVELYLDVRLETLDFRVAWRERDGLGGDECDGKAQTLGGNLGR